MTRRKWTKRSAYVRHSHQPDITCAQGAANDVSGGAEQQQPQDLTSPGGQQDSSAAQDAGAAGSQQQLQQEVLAQGAQVRFLRHGTSIACTFAPTAAGPSVR
jgi:hypothetical protein